MELEHGPVPEDAFELGAAQDEPRPAARLGRRAAARPAAAHAQVRAEDDAALEAQHQVLPDRLDRLEPPPVELLGDVRRLRARVRRLDLERLADERLKPRRRAVERVALRHR